MISGDPHPSWFDDVSANVRMMMPGRPREIPGASKRSSRSLIDLIIGLAFGEASSFDDPSVDAAR